MRSPRIEGPPVLQPVVGESSTVQNESEDSPVEEVMEDDKPPTPPMPVLVEGEDYDDNDIEESSFEILDEVTVAKSNGPPTPDPASKSVDSPPIPLSNGVVNKENADFKPLMPEFPKTTDERINGDHEEPVLEKFFRLFKPASQDPMKTEAVSEYLTAKLAEVSPQKKPTEPEPDSEPAPEPKDGELKKMVPETKEVDETLVESEPTADVTTASEDAASPSKRRRRAPRKSSPDNDDDRSPSPKRGRKRKSPQAKAVVSPGEVKAKAGRSKKTNDVSEDVDNVDDVASSSKALTKEANKDELTRPGRKPRKSPQRRNQRVKKNDGAKSVPPAKPGRKPTTKKDRAGNPNAPEARYTRSPYIVSTSENDSIVSRFQVVNPALRDAASVNILDHPFKHSVKTVPVASLAPRPWLCVFCGHGTTFSELGCLFGPYFIDIQKLVVPAGCIYPLDEPELDSGSTRPEPVPEPCVPSVPSPPPSAPITSRNSSRNSSSRPSSPVQNGERLVNGEDVELSEVTSDASVCADSENVSDTNASSCRETRSTRRSIHSPYDDNRRPSSISSFRFSKTKNSQALIVAKDVRRSSVENDKKSKGVRQVDIAAMFFSSDHSRDQQGNSSNATSDKSSKRVSSRRKSEPQTNQIIEELTKKFKLRLDRTDAIPKKSQSATVAKKNKEETSVPNDFVKECAKSEPCSTKSSNESVIDDGKQSSEKFESESKQTPKSTSENKKTVSDEESSGKVPAKDETKGKNACKEKLPAKRKCSPPRKPIPKATPNSASVQSAKRAAKAKLETAKQTASAKKSKKDSVGRGEAALCKKYTKNENMASEQEEGVPRGRGRPRKNSPNKAATTTKPTEKKATVSVTVKQEKKANEPKVKPKKDGYEDARLSSNGEVWFHMECVLWASGTYLNGKAIIGLEETLNVALQAICKSCHKRGAMLACVQRGCDRTFHFYCAVKEGAYLDHEQFCIYCVKHKSKILLSRLGGGPTQSNFLSA